MSDGFVVAKLAQDKVQPGETDKVIADLRLPKGKYLVLAKGVVYLYSVDFPDFDDTDDPDPGDLTLTVRLTVHKDNVRKSKGQAPLYLDSWSKLGMQSQTFCLTLGADARVACRVRLTVTNHLSRRYAIVQEIRLTAITLDKLTLKS